MAGFASSSYGTFQRGVPRVSPFASPNTIGNRNVSPPPATFRDLARFRTPTNYSNSGADESNWHRANVYMGRSGMGDLGGQSGQHGEYGFTGEDFNRINRFVSNPQSPEYANEYNNIIAHMRNRVAANPQFATFSPEQRETFSTNFPQGAAFNFGSVPPPSLQNPGLGFGTFPEMR